MRAHKVERRGGELVMRVPESMMIFAVLAVVLIVEFAGAGAFLVASAHANPTDLCFGYAVCQ